MILYHGSTKTGLKELKYREELSRFGGDQNLKHGSGIYLTTSLEEAIAYAGGGSYYLVKVNGPIFDASDKECLIEFISKIESELKCSKVLLENPMVVSLIYQVLEGTASGVNFAKSLVDLINDVEPLYNKITLELFQGDLDQINDFIQGHFNYKAIKLNNVGSNSWVIALDPEGSNLEILEEVNCSTNVF